MNPNDALRRSLEASVRALDGTFAFRLEPAFGWEPRGPAGRVIWRREGTVRLWFNLRPLRTGASGSEDGQQLFLRFFCRWMAEHARFLSGAETEPVSYLHGLALLERLARRNNRNASRDVWLPRRTGPVFRGRRPWFSAVSLLCARPALVWASGQRELPPETAVLDALEQLPEIGWYGGRTPESSLAWSWKQAGTFPPDLDAPVLRAFREAPPEGGPWETGLALRLAALSDAPLARPLWPTARDLQTAGTALAEANRRWSGPFLFACLTAAEKLLLPLNRTLCACDAPVGAGTVHPMGGVWSGKTLRVKSTRRIE